MSSILFICKWWKKLTSILRANTDIIQHYFIFSTELWSTLVWSLYRYLQYPETISTRVKSKRTSNWDGPIFASDKHIHTETYSRKYFYYYFTPQQQNIIRILNFVHIVVDWICAPTAPTPVKTKDMFCLIVEVPIEFIWFSNRSFFYCRTTKKQKKASITNSFVSTTKSLFILQPNVQALVQYYSQNTLFYCYRINIGSISCLTS